MSDLSQEQITSLTVNFGALVGGITVAISLVVFLVCFIISGIGPRCCRRLVESCHRRSRHGIDHYLPDDAVVHCARSLQPIKGGAPAAVMSPRFVQLPAAGRLRPPGAVGSLRPGAEIKSAPNPTRPAPLASPAPGPARHRQSPPLSQPPQLPPMLRINVDSRNNNNMAGWPGKQQQQQPAASMAQPQPAAVTRSTPQNRTLTLQAGNRRGLAAMQLSLSTIRDSSAGGQIPPDCLYAAPESTSPSPQSPPRLTAPVPSLISVNDVDETASAGLAAVGAANAPSPSAAAMSLRVQIGSAYGSLPPATQPAPLRPLPPPLQLFQSKQPPHSNASSSECNDWSPPRPRPPPGVAAGANAGVAAAVWASEDGDVAVFDLEASSAINAAVHNRGLHGGVDSRGNADQSTSF